MTLDEYVAWAAGVGVNLRAGAPEDRTLVNVGLGFAREIGEVAGVLARWLRGDVRRRDELADSLGEVAYYWARLCVVSGVAPSVLLARSRSHVEWRRDGRPAGGPAREPVAMASKSSLRGRWRRMALLVAPVRCERHDPHRDADAKPSQDRQAGALDLTG